MTNEVLAGNDPLVRIQLEVRKSYVRVLRTLQAIGGIGSNKELFNNAIALLQWAVEQRQQGLVIAAVTQQGEVKRELVLPYLEEAARTKLRLASNHRDQSSDAEVVAGRRARA